VQRVSFLPTTFHGVHRFRIHHADRYYLPRIVCLGGEAKTRFGVAVILHDVTEFRLLDELKTNLIATVSHELKTPLTSIRTVLLMLLQQMRDTLSAKQAELIGIASDESERLLHTLDTLLDLTRFEEACLKCASVRLAQGRSPPPSRRPLRWLRFWESR
jgi:signal transduction histidine kinase